MKSLCLVAVFTFITYILSAQTDSIEVRYHKYKGNLQHNYLYNGRDLKKTEQYMSIVQSDSQASHYLKIAKRNSIIGRDVFYSLTGGAIAGVIIFSNPKPSISNIGNVFLLGIDAAFFSLLVSLPFYSSSSRNIDFAVQSYNYHLRKHKLSTRHSKPKWDLAFSGNSIGIQMNF